MPYLYRSIRILLIAIVALIVLIAFCFASATGTAGTGVNLAHRTTVGRQLARLSLTSESHRGPKAPVVRYPSRCYHHHQYLSQSCGIDPDPQNPFSPP